MNDSEKVSTNAAALSELPTVRMMLPELKKTMSLVRTWCSFMSMETTASPAIMMMTENPSMATGYSAVVLCRASSDVMTRSSER